ncbi:MAG TPA: sigma-54-dependent Fis family transcriptional regulator [Ignavibacteriales bacterium]|nr:sigma-54-dependent Fis family transcriptional regulator [Ignavibacteriales bacterium]
MSYRAENIAPEKLAALVEMAEILGRQSGYEEVLRLVVERASGLVNADSALIMMINPKTRDTIKTIYAEKNPADELNHFLHTNICGWVLIKHTSLLSSDIKQDNRFRKNLFEKTCVGSVLCVPLRIENTIIGTILLLKNEKGTVFTENDLILMELFSAVTSPFLHCTQDIERYFSAQLPKEVLLNKYSLLGLYGKSPRFIELLQAIEAAARCDVKILLEGESGTGKELVARAVHKLSSRSSRKFVAIDCGAIQPNLVESELFGHIKGSFTGAVMDRKGLFEEAHGGTLFMDEINNLPFEMQSKLLRVLQDEEIRPVGSNNVRKVDVRIITASSVSLKKLVAENKFREDLFYRLNVYPIFVPSLNDRTEDIPLLADCFLKKFSCGQNKDAEALSEEVLDFMKQRKWAGNIRELENFVERLVTLVPQKQKTIDRKILPPEFHKEMQKLKKDYTGLQPGKSLSESLEACEEDLIRAALNKCGLNQSKAAEMLKISEHSMRYKMGKLKIVKPG